MGEIKPKYVYHFAAQAINGISSKIPFVTTLTNVQGTQNLFIALRRQNLKPRVLVAGSSTEYGKTAEIINGPIPENAPFVKFINEIIYGDVFQNPVTPYGSSKVYTEMVARENCWTHQIPTVTARFFIQVGIGGTPFLAIQQFCKQIALAGTSWEKAFVPSE